MARRYRTRNSERPTGVELVAVYGGIEGVLGAVAGIALIIGGLEGVLPAVAGVVAVALNVGKVVVSMGIWRLQRWAYEWALVLYGGTALLGVVMVVLGNPLVGGSTVAVAGLICLYLYTQRRRFRRARY